MNAVSLMVHKILKPCLGVQISFLFALSALLLPGIALSQSAENPAFTVIAIDVDGKSVSSTSGIGFARYGKAGDPVKPLAVNDGITTSNIKTPANTALTLRTLNGNTIRLMAASTLATSALNRAGERYALLGGTAEFEVTAPLGFFQIDNAKFAVAASDAKFRVQRIDGSTANETGSVDKAGEMEVELMRGKASVQRLYELSIADSAQKPKVRMAEILTVSPSLATASKTKLNFDSRKNEPMQFATVPAATLFFKNRTDDAIKSKDDERIAEALLAQADFLSGINEHRGAILVLQAWQTTTAGNNIAQYNAQMELADAYIALKEDRSAIAHLLLALKIIDGPFSIGSAHGRIAVYKMLSETYLRLNDQTAATKYAKFYTAYNQKYTSPTFKGPTLTARGNTEFPKKMRQWGLDGSVFIKGLVTTDGVFEYLRAGKSIHPAFEMAAVKGMMSMRTTPATVEGNPIPVSTGIPFNFMLTSSKRSAISEHAAFKFPKVNSSKPVGSQYDVAPEITVVSLPAYPRALLQENVTGIATVSVVLDQLGTVQDVTIVEATHPDFGAATKAMMQNWEFAPALKAGKPISVQFNFEHRFQFNQRDNGISDETLQAMRYVKSYPAEVYEVTSLDANPKVLYRPEAADPRKTLASASTVDNVQIEFIIDREGGVQLPRIVSATNMDLAWSVATVLQRWLFEVPKLKGDAVFARKEMLFEFK
jgi:TonB family protein